MQPVNHTSPTAGGPPDPRTAAAGLAAPLAIVTCDGIELVQAVQSLPAHDVPLVAGKTTLVRVYLSTSAAAPIIVRGTLTGQLDGGTARELLSANTVVIDPAENGQLRLKRETLDKGLYFVLPADLTAAGHYSFRLSALEQSSPTAPLVVPAGAERFVEFVATPPLRVHILGLRFRPDPDEPEALVPRPLDFALVRSWLGRAYPVAEVVWSSAVVEFAQSWPFDADSVNAYLRTIRQADVASGTDPRTHYYGMVFEGDEGDFFLRGKASVPAVPNPAAVGCGPTGGTRWTNWDTDGSYGDWYAAHEIGHTFGRPHANFCGAAGGSPYPFPNGRISPNDGSHVGLDVGDAANGIPLRALPGLIWHDVMTYCEFQWVSRFTYTAIRDRLVAEDAFGPGGAPPATPGGTGMSGSVHIVATINRTRGTGAITSVVPSAARPTPAPAGPASAVVLRVADAAGQVLGEYDAPWIPNVCQDPGSDETGMTDALIPTAPAAAAVELLVSGKVVAEFRRGVPPVAVRDIRSEAPPALAPAGPTLQDPVITWVDDAAALAGPAPSGRPPSYLVAVSTDDGGTWRTIAANLPTPTVTLDRSLLSGATDVRVRITATDGFAAETVTKTFSAADL